MSEIVLMNKSVEIKTIEVPDYSDKINKIEKLKERNIESETIKNSTIQLLQDSILDQIAIYLFELYKPLLVYCKEKYISMPTDIVTLCGNWRITNLEMRPGEQVIVLDYRYSIYSDSKILIKITKDDYTISKDECANIGTENIDALIEYWHNLKDNAQQSMKNAIIKLQEEENKVYNTNIKTIETYTNFKL